MRFIEKIKNSKPKKIMALGLTGAIIVGSGATIGYNTAKKMKENDFELSDKISFYDALEDISSLSYVDDIIVNEDLYKFNDESNKLNLDETLKVYEDARINEKMYELNNSLENLGLLVLKSSIIDSLKLNENNINELKIVGSDEVYVRYDKEVSNLVAGNITDIDVIEEEKTYKLKGKACNLIEIINNAQAHIYTDEKSVDYAYKEIIKFLYTKGNINDNFLVKDSIEFKYDQEIIKKLKK